jgi:hypothetical protein
LAGLTAMSSLPFLAVLPSQLPSLMRPFFSHTSLIAADAGATKEGANTTANAAAASDTKISIVFVFISLLIEKKMIKSYIKILAKIVTIENHSLYVTRTGRRIKSS